jgi:nitroreductase
MDVIEAMRSRKSIRAFKPDPVPKETIREILDAAIRAPSRDNSHPWEIAVVTGEALDNIKRGNIEMLASGTMPNPDVVMNPLEGTYRKRQVDLAVQLFQLMGIAREDKEKRGEWMQRGFRFFDAPVGIILYADSSLDLAHTQFDVSAVAQTICLAALNYGLGTCIEIQGVMYPEVVRKYTGIPESKRMTMAIALGYPDWDFPANRVQSEREAVDSITTWCGFD